MKETTAQFEQRKKDHIRIALDPQSQASGFSGLDQVQFIHEALPDLNFDELKIQSQIFSHDIQAPLLISSMTAGHEMAPQLNRILAQAAARRGWPMGVGSQRRELSDQQAAHEWTAVRKEAPGAILLGNLGIAQIIQTPISDVQRLIDNLEASALFVHLNPLQECLQQEGTPQFKGGLKALENLCRNVSVPVIVKEVGCGFSAMTLRRLRGIGLAAVDIAGLGGTHWGRIEGSRSPEGDLRFEAAKTFKNWGLSTVESLATASECDVDYELWASGGVRSGLDAGKLLAMGAGLVGVAQPLLQAALLGEKILDQVMARFEYELKMVLFCTGCEDLNQLRTKKVWTWK